MEKKSIPMEEFHHANLYYVVMALSAILGIFFLVQGVRYHLDDEIYYALAFYTMGVLWFVIAKSSHTRGKGHYHYHRHLQ